jgi:serine/threonine protein kinase
MASIPPNMDCPFLRSFEEFDSICEAFDSQTQKVKYTTFQLFQDGHAYFGQIFKPKSTITLEECSAALKRVPDWEVFPELPKDAKLKIAGETESSYIKLPNLSIYELVEGTSFLADLLLHEAQIMDQLQKAPHPNIVRYHGVNVKDGRITGLVFDRYPQNLLTHRKQATCIRIGEVMEAIVSAIVHLHSLNLAHNDINPENIMLDDKCRPVLIDFGSCQKEGQRVLSGGTPGWVIKDFVTSSKAHDFFALGKLHVWLVCPEFE